MWGGGGTPGEGGLLLVLVIFKVHVCKTFLSMLDRDIRECKISDCNRIYFVNLKYNCLSNAPPDLCVNGYL